MDALFIMTVNARGNCQHGSIVKQSVGILSRNLSISLISKHSKMFYTVSNLFSFFYNFDNNYKYRITETIPPTLLPSVSRYIFRGISISWFAIIFYDI